MGLVCMLHRFLAFNIMKELNQKVISILIITMVNMNLIHIFPSPIFQSCIYFSTSVYPKVRSHAEVYLQSSIDESRSWDHHFFMYWLLISHLSCQFKLTEIEFEIYLKIEMKSKICVSIAIGRCYLVFFVGCFLHQEEQWSLYCISIAQGSLREGKLVVAFLSVILGGAMSPIASCFTVTQACIL